MIAILKNTLALRQIRARKSQGLERGQEHLRDQSLDGNKCGAGENLVQEARGVGLDGLGNETSRFTGVGEIFDGVDEAAGDVTEVDAGEAVDFAGVAADLAVSRVRCTLLGGGDGDVLDGPRIIVGATVPVLGDPLVAVGVDEIVVGVAGVGEEGLESRRSEDAARIAGGVIGQQLEREHVRTEGESNTGVRGGEVVGVGTDGMEFPVVLMLGQDAWCQVASRPLLREVKQFLSELGVRGTVGVHGRRKPIATSDGGISFGLQVAVSANTGLVAQSVAQGTKRLGLVGVVADAPSSGQWISIEEHGGCLQENGRRVVKTEGCPQTGIDGFGGSNTVAWKVAMIGSSV